MKKAPRDGIDPTAIFHPSKSATARPCISAAVIPEAGTARAQLRAGRGGEAPRSAGSPAGRMRHHSPPATAQLLARSAEHDKDVSHPLDLITGLLNNRVA